MVEVVQLTAEHTLTLPAEIASHFRPSDQFIVWREADTLYLKRVTPPPVTDIVAQAPKGKPMSPEEVSEVVHGIRRKRKRK